MIDFVCNNILYYFKMYDEDWGQFIVIDDNNKEDFYYYYAYPQSCLYPFLNEILQKLIIKDNYHSFEFMEILSYCFQNLLYGNR